MRGLDGMRVIGSADVDAVEGVGSRWRELVSAADTGGRWRLGEVSADPDENFATRLHPGEGEPLIVLEGTVELHAARHGPPHAGRCRLDTGRHGTRPDASQRRSLAGHMADSRAGVRHEIRRLEPRVADR